MEVGLNLLAHAEALYQRAHDDPRGVADAAGPLIGRARRAGQTSAAAVALQAQGQAFRYLNRGSESVDSLRQAVRVAITSGDGRLEQRIRVSLADALVLVGDLEAALDELETVVADSAGELRARALAQRSLVLERAGRWNEALASYRQAVPELRRAGEPTALATALANRGVLNAYLGRLGQARRDTVEARDLYLASAHRASAARVHHNLGFIAGQAGDVPSALSRFDEAEAELEQLGVPVSHMLLDRCEVLMSAGLADEACELAQRAIDELAGSGMEIELAEAELTAARAELDAGDATAAIELAGRAEARLERQGRSGWSALAAFVAFEASWASETVPSGEIDGAVRLAARLAAAGFTHQAARCQLRAGQIAVMSGQFERGEVLLQDLARVRRSGIAPLRVLAWHAEALLRRSRDDRFGCEAALRAGLRVVDEYRAALGASDFRASVTKSAEGLARVGLDLALEARSAKDVLKWVERYRAASVDLPPVRPPQDATLAAELAELRGIVQQERATVLATAAAEADRDGPAEADVAGSSRQRLEESIRRRSRRVAGDEIRHRRPLQLAQIRRLLGDAALIEYFQHRGQLWSVTVTSRATRLARHGDPSEIGEETAALLLGLRRMIRQPAETGGGDIARTLAVGAARRLDELLLGPIEHASRVVIVPPGELQALPWSLLPSLASTSINVAPSANAWARATQRQVRQPPRRVVLAAGPGLRHAVDEIESIAALYPDPTVLTGEDATGSRLAEAVPGADLLHIAAHGTFRRDNPLFSAIELADGPMTAYDLQRLPDVAPLVVLANCESGLTDVRPGDELLGISATLMSKGVRTLLATIVPIPDAATPGVMVDFHRHLAAGVPPSTALRRSVRTSADPSFVDAAAAAFVCFGAG